VISGYIEEVMAARATHRESAGILAFRRHDDGIQVLLVHPGGPFWVDKDEGVWSIPKGLIEAGEDPLETARREFAEETGFDAEGSFVPLGDIRQPSGKIVHAWAVEADFDPSLFRSNTFSLDWPPHSGTQADFPEIDRGEWFSLDQARAKISVGQRDLLERLQTHIGSG
jgi:predicted NUDIX family NTP pyrophosphohydrolase